MRAVSLTEEPSPKPPMEAADKYFTHKDTHRETDEDTRSTERFSLQCTELLFAGG